MTPLNQNGISRLRLTPGAALCLSIVAVAILSTASSAEKADHDNHEGHGRDELAQKHDDHAEHDDHEEHEAAAEHDDHEEHDDHGHEAHADHEEEGLRLTAEQRKRFRIKAQPAAPGSLRSEISLPGEIIFNGDLVVDGADFLIWQNSFPILNGSATKAQGDANSDGNVDGADFLIWQSDFLVPGRGANATPEPGTLVLLLAMATAIFATRRLRKLI